MLGLIWRLAPTIQAPNIETFPSASTVAHAQLLVTPRGSEYRTVIAAEGPMARASLRGLRLLLALRMDAAFILTLEIVGPL